MEDFQLNFSASSNINANCLIKNTWVYFFS